MNILAPILLCFIPAVTVLILFAILIPGISIAKEFLAAISGLISFIPIVILQIFFPIFTGHFKANLLLILLYSLLFCGLLEEFFKFLLMNIIPAKNEELLHFFSYSIVAGLVFGGFESVIYFISGLKNAETDAVSLIYIRSLTALVIHALCAGLSGFSIYSIKNIRKNLSPLFLAVVIHGVYDFFILLPHPVSYFAIAVILLAALECRICYMRAADEISAKKYSKSAGGLKADAEKTVAIPESGAVVIPVKSTEPLKIIHTEKKEEKTASTVTAKKTSEKKSPVKKAETKTTARSTSKKAPAASTKKTASKQADKPAVKNTAKAVAKAESKTAAKKSASKPAAKASTKSAAAKKAPAKTTAKKTAAKPAAKTSTKSTAKKTKK